MYLIVCPHVQSDGQTLVWLDARECGVQRQLAHWDAHAVSSKIAETKDSLAVSEHYSPHVWFRPV